MITYIIFNELKKKEISNHFVVDLRLNVEYHIGILKITIS